MKDIYLFILTFFLFFGCKDIKKEDNADFSFDEKQFSKQFIQKETISLTVLNPKSKNIDSIVYYTDETKIGKTTQNTPLKLILTDLKLGYHDLKALIYSENIFLQINTKFEIVSDIQPTLLKYKIVKKYPHDTESFTEGLEFHNDILYESTGKKGTSYFRKYDYKTGKVFQQVNLDSGYFGEGITVIDNKLYQLTWTERTGFIYDIKTLKLEKTFRYDKDIEGWGMTNDGKIIYHTDGSEKIWKMLPNTQKMIGYINVYSGITKIEKLNELEWVEGKLYANVWEKDALAVINPNTGAVEAIIDLSDLRKLAKNRPDDTLNGIAYNPKTKTLFVTGKNWDTLFEIKILN